MKKIKFVSSTFRPHRGRTVLTQFESPIQKFQLSPLTIDESSECKISFGWIYVWYRLVWLEEDYFWNITISYKSWLKIWVSLFISHNYTPLSIEHIEYLKRIVNLFNLKHLDISYYNETRSYEIRTILYVNYNRKYGK